MRKNLKVHDGNFRSEWDIYTLLGMFLGIISLLAFLSTVLPGQLLGVDAVHPLSSYN